jgi:hypothetical protein
MLKTVDIPIAHIDDLESVAALTEAVRALHGPTYEFVVSRWAGEIQLEPQPGQAIYCFIIAAEDATIALRRGDRIRGPAPNRLHRLLEGPLAEVTEPYAEMLWPGDVVCVDGSASAPLKLLGRGTYFQVTTEQTAYAAPTAAFLRHLTDRPGGCAAYPGAFRREALPPQRPVPDAADRRGANRVNEHTLDMRFDRTPPPIRHYHGPVACGNGQMVNHTETAIVLPRSIYHLPEVDQPDQGQLIIYRRPAEDPTDQVIIPVRPGSIVVTPATETQVMGHCFENAFAMLVAIPGFVGPYNFIE